MIQYATFLDKNSKVLRNCENNIAKLLEENKVRDAEIERKQKQLAILKAKKVRIEQQKTAVEQYHLFLEDVKTQNTDDGFNDVNEIQLRH